MDDLNEALMKVVAGPEKRSRLRLKQDQKLTAYHEAGHAVAMYYLPTHDPVRQISIIPRGQALGLTWSMPRDDSNHLTRNEMYEQIVGLLGGRVAEEVFLQDVSTGASNDIDRATELARDMVARYGMCERLGTVAYRGTESYSESFAGSIDEEVKKLTDRAYAQCRTILTDHAAQLERVAAYLLEHETMSGAQFRACMEGKPVEEAPVTTLFESDDQT